MICVWVGDTRHVIVDSELEAFQGQWAASLASGRLLSVKGPETGTERLLNPHAVLYAEPYEPPEDPSDERHVLVSGPYWDEERGRWTGECSCGKEFEEKTDGAVTTAWGAHVDAAAGIAP